VAQGTQTMDGLEIIGLSVVFMVLVFCMLLFILFIVIAAHLFVLTSIEIFLATWNGIYFHDFTCLRVCICERPR
jgi:hypothetical protein